MEPAMKFQAKVIGSRGEVAMLDIEACDSQDAAGQVLAQGKVLLSLHARSAWRLVFRPRLPRLPRRQRRRRPRRSADSRFARGCG